MVLLADSFSLITPEIGLFFWTMLIFVLLWLILGKFAFGPIGKALRDRAQTIEDSLKQAEKARDEMASLQSDHEKMKAEAAEERSRIVREARQTADNMVNDARDRAKEEADRIVASASEQIENQKMAALIEVKNQVGKMSLDIAEKVLRKELQNPEDQQSYVNSLVEEFNKN
jgi:F-type H+-transporting ATPase subunit b